jgi:hypothetical protein
MDAWMHEVAKTYSALRATRPEDRVLIVFDIDGTLLDPEVVAKEGDDPGSREAVLAAHRSCRGTMDVARWFDAQPLTSVAINSQRLETERAATRGCLDVLGQEYRLSFADALLHLRADSHETELAAKRQGLRHWREQGFQIAAVVDSDPQVIKHLASEDELAGIAFLPAESIYKARRESAFEAGHDPPRHVELVWHRVNDAVNLRQFLGSPIRWGEVDMRLDSDGGLVIRHDTDRADDVYGDDVPSPGDVIDAFRDAGKGMTIDLKDESALDAVLGLVTASDLPEDSLCINGRVDKLHEPGLRKIVKTCPDARLQCPVEFLGPMVAAMPEHARRVVTTLQHWGVDQFSVAWPHAHACILLEQLDAWGVDVNLYAVTDLPDFLSAVLMLPRSITAEFTMPEWHYFGRGIGNDGRFHREHAKAAVRPGMDVP